MTSKEALENFILIKHCMNCMHCNFLEDCDDLEKPCDKWRRIIEQDLNKVEELKKENLYLQIQNKTLNEMIQVDKRIETHIFELIKENKKLKKVIEILKDVLIFEINFYEENNKTYYYIALYSKNDKAYLDRMNISKEQYDLLKEWFGNVKD